MKKQSFLFMTVLMLIGFSISPVQSQSSFTNLNEFTKISAADGVGWLSDHDGSGWLYSVDGAGWLCGADGAGW